MFNNTVLLLNSLQLHHCVGNNIKYKLVQSEIVILFERVISIYDYLTL